MRKSIENFPAAIQPLLAGGFPEREFRAAMNDHRSYLDCAEYETFDVLEYGSSVTKVRDGLKAGEKESYTYFIGLYGALVDLKMSVSRVGIASQFLLNAAISGEQAANTLNSLIQNVLHATFKAELITSTILRPNGRKYPEDLNSLDMLTEDSLKLAVKQLEDDGIPTIDGFYNCYLDTQSVSQLFARYGFIKRPRRNFSTVSSSLKLRFIVVPDTFAVEHPRTQNLYIRQTLIVGADAVIMGSYEELPEINADPNRHISIVDNVSMVVYGPQKNDPNQTITQSWYWVGGFGAVIDRTDPENPTFKRAVMIEHT